MQERVEIPLNIMSKNAKHHTALLILNARAGLPTHPFRKMLPHPFSNEISSFFVRKSFYLYLPPMNAPPIGCVDAIEHSPSGTD